MRFFVIFYLVLAMAGNAYASAVPLAEIEAEKAAAKAAAKPKELVDENPPPKPLRKPAIAETVSLDADEEAPLPPYPPKAMVAVGKTEIYTIGEEDTLLDVARYFELGFIELMAANPHLDAWTPMPGDKVTLPKFRLLPRAEQKGIVVNLAEMRLYYFKDKDKEPITFPIGIGKEGLSTPVGETTIINKVANPVWIPTARMLEEKPWLPKAIPAGNSNPLGTHALYLGWPTFLMHGSNKPWAIGRRVSSGCMRMYPEDIIKMFNMVPVGTPVTIVDQPILLAWIGDELFLEANPSKTQGDDIEITGSYEVKPLTEGLKQVIKDAAGDKAAKIDWATVEKIVKERRGYPLVIISSKIVPSKKEVKKPAVPVKYN